MSELDVACLKLKTLIDKGVARDSEKEIKRAWAQMAAKGSVQYRKSLKTLVR